MGAIREIRDSTAVRVSDSPPTVLVERLRAVAVYDLMPRNWRGRDRYAFGGQSVNPLADMLNGQGVRNSLHTTDVPHISR